MAMLSSYLSNLVNEMIFFSGDVQTTTIAIAITSSLCCSIVYLVLNLFSTTLGQNDQTGTKDKTVSDRRTSMVSFHLRRNVTNKKLVRRNTVQSCTKSVWACRQVEKHCAVPCVRCSSQIADKLCRFVLCSMCCHSNPSSCDHHVKGTVAAQGVVEGACDDKPTEVDLSYLKLQQCPDRVGFIGAQLSTLNLSNNNLNILPEEIGFLRGLEELYLQYNNLSQLPESIGNLEKVTELDVKNNELQELPDSIGCLARLTSLRLTNNLLRAIPESIGNLSNLDELSANANQLENLPESIGNLSKLTVLYLGDNQLSHLPECFGHLVRLTELDLSYNRLEELPISLCRCAALSRMWLSHNQISSLPGQFGRLQQLRELHLKNNHLQYLPASITSLQLYTFSVGDNPWVLEWDKKRVCSLTTSPDTELPGLQELAARATIRSKVTWKDGDIPAHLEKLLKNCRECSSCEGPLLEYYQSQVTFKSVGLSPKLPLYQHICSPFPNTSHCRLMPIS